MNKKEKAKRSYFTLTLVCKNARLLLTFSILCTRIRPLLGLPSFSPEIISSSLSNLMPSARSTNKSTTSILACNNQKNQLATLRKFCSVDTIRSKYFTFARNEFIHFVKVFFWMCKRSSCSVLMRSFSNLCMPSRCVMFAPFD